MISNDLILTYSLVYLLVLAVTVHIYKSRRKETKSIDKAPVPNQLPIIKSEMNSNICLSWRNPKSTPSLSKLSTRPSIPNKSLKDSSTNDEDSFTNTDDDDENDSGFGNDITEFILPELASDAQMFLFPDLTDEARGMFIDLTYTHKFKLRGSNYLIDNKNNF